MKLEIALIGLAFLGGMTFQQQTGTKPAAAPTTQDWGDDPMANPEFMAAWIASSTPGEHHAELAKAAGTWDVVTKMYMSPGAEATDSPAHAESKMILGGRYLMEEFKSEFMGQPFDGVLLSGYDNLHGEYFSIWLDTMSTWPSVVRGKKDKEGRVSQSGLMHDVMSPEGRPYRHVSWEEDGKFRTTMYDTLPDGTEWEVMDMTYSRKK